MRKDISEFFLNSPIIDVKVGDKTLKALLMAEIAILTSGSRFTININSSEIDFEITEGPGQDITLPDLVVIQDVKYEVLSGRLINENRQINPFYQLELIIL